MHLMGLVVLGYMWCRIVEAAMARLAVDEAAEAMRGKLVIGRFFVDRMLPETAVHLARIRLGAGNVMELPAEAF
jgi:acyl-CoA dehydrogenase